MKKSAKLECHEVNSNIAVGSLPTLQTLHGLLALFEKIYYGDPVFPSSQITGRMYYTDVSNKVYDVKSESQPDAIALLGINYCLQIIETWFAEWFYASHTMGPAQILLKISASLA
jgi:hypothetical protein